MINRESVFPSEIEKFFINKQYFKKFTKKLIERKIGGDVETLNIQGLEMDIIISKALLKEIIGGVYGRRVKAIEERSDSIEVVISKPKLGRDEEKGGIDGLKRWFVGLFKSEKKLRVLEQ